MLSVYNALLVILHFNLSCIFAVLCGRGEIANVPHRKNKSQHNKEGILDKATPTWLTIFFFAGFNRKAPSVFFCVFCVYLTFLLLLNAP